MYKNRERVLVFLWLSWEPTQKRDKIVICWSTSWWLLHIFIPNGSYSYIFVNKVVVTSFCKIFSALKCTSGFDFIFHFIHSVRSVCMNLLNNISLKYISYQQINFESYFKKQPSMIYKRQRQTAGTQREREMHCKNVHYWVIKCVHPHRYNS